MAAVIILLFPKSHNALARARKCLSKHPKLIEFARSSLERELKPRAEGLKPRAKGLLQDYVTKVICL